jgi:predicted DNA-binding transcriptional regulator YafY
VSKAKLERLLNLTALLIETPRPLSALEIRERMEGYPDDQVAFRQAFERDKRDLREMGIPLSVETVPGVMPAVDGYRIPKDRYYLADPGLTPDELAALHLAAEVVRLEGGAADEGLAKLGAVDGPEPAPPDADLAALPGRDDLGALFGAVIDRRPVRFTYRDQARKVDPYRLDFQRGRWYLTGFDHGRDDERVYRLDRIAGEVEVLEGPAFQRPAPAAPSGPVEPGQLGEDEPVMARVAVDAVQAPWIVDHLGMEAVVERPDDGSVVVELPVTNRESFRSFVLTFLDHAEVLEPVALRDDMVGWLEELAR